MPRVDDLDGIIRRAAQEHVGMEFEPDLWRFFGAERADAFAREVREKTGFKVHRSVDDASDIALVLRH